MVKHSLNHNRSRLVNPGSPPQLSAAPPVSSARAAPLAPASSDRLCSGVRPSRLSASECAHLSRPHLVWRLPALWSASLCPNSNRQQDATQTRHSYEWYGKPTSANGIACIAFDMFSFVCPGLATNYPNTGYRY